MIFEKNDKLEHGTDNISIVLRQLQTKICQGQYDDVYLQLLIRVRKLAPQAEYFAVFYSLYALAHGNYEVALSCARDAFHVRKVNRVIWHIMIDCYSHMERYDYVAYFQGLCKKFYGEPLKLNLDMEQKEQILSMLSLGNGIANYAPLSAGRAFFDENGLRFQGSLFTGEYLPEIRREGVLPYFVGIYPHGTVSSQNMDHVVKKLSSDEEFIANCSVGTIFDLMRSNKAKEEYLNPVGTYILPLAPTVNGQEIQFDFANESRKVLLYGRLNYNFYRIDDQTRVSSKQDMVIGKTIRLGHSPKRKKLVLNILADALAWEYVRTRFDKLMPRTKAFFSHGMIFDNHYSVSEYTFPSLATIETGLYPAESQIFHEKCAVRLDDEVKTLSEQMNALGYYCVNIMSDGNGAYTGVTRGYDRMIVKSYDNKAYEGVSRTIDQLEAFSECDQFLFLHIDDPHPWPLPDYRARLSTQTHLPLDDRLTTQRYKASVNIYGRVPLYMRAIDDYVQMMDRNLGMLYDYLEENYRDDEYVVQLYSDHGTGVYDLGASGKIPILVGDYSTHAALMMRGCGIPARGLVTDELTSTVDLYNIMAHHAGGKWKTNDGNLPAALGGKKREYTVSYVVYPGQKFAMCIRTGIDEFVLESQGPLYNDGTVNLDDASCRILPRDGSAGADTPERRAYFMQIAGYLVRHIHNHGISWVQGRV